tara:strand:+ start:6036 stop:6770 length:735 start_codon:yes stop_codon:yes gene_type:complete
MNSKNNIKPNFKIFWDGLEDSGHTFNTLDWYKKYAEEMIPYFSKRDIVLDCGCGSGEMITSAAKYFNKIIGVDFSQSMLDKAKQIIKLNNVDNIELLCANFTEIDEYSKQKVNGIYNNGVLQYIHFDETLIFLEKAKRQLIDGGEIIFFNVPNIKYLDLYGLRVFHSDERVNPINLLKKHVRLSKDIIKEKIKNKNYIYDAGIGYWYSEEDFRELAKLSGLKVEISASKFLHYAYRMHAKFTIL